MCAEDRSIIVYKFACAQVATTTSSQFPHSSAITSGPTLREMQSVGIQVVPPTPEVFQPPPEFSEGKQVFLRTYNKYMDLKFV